LSAAEVLVTGFFLGADQGIKTNPKQLISTDRHAFSDTKEAPLHFCPLNPIDRVYYLLKAVRLP